MGTYWMRKTVFDWLMPVYTRKINWPSTLSNTEGYFNIKLKSRYPQAALTVSKEFYEDTTVFVNPKQNQALNISIVPVSNNNVTISPEDYFLPDSVTEQKQQFDTAAIRAARIDTSAVDKDFSVVFVSSGQKIQSLNIGNWFVDRPFQFSITPGLSTHGKMSGQVINHFSLNMLGGYTGGLKGFEIGGLFNINKKDAGYFQAAGFIQFDWRQAGRISGCWYCQHCHRFYRRFPGGRNQQLQQVAHARFPGSRCY